MVPIVPDRIKIENNEEFFGLFHVMLSTRCWGSDNRLIVSTNQRNTVESYVIDVGEYNSDEYMNRIMKRSCAQ